LFIFNIFSNTSQKKPTLCFFLPPVLHEHKNVQFFFPPPPPPCSIIVKDLIRFWKLYNYAQTIYYPAFYTNYPHWQHSVKKKSATAMSRKKPLEVMIVNSSKVLQVYFKLSAQYVAWYFVILNVVATAFATHVFNKPKGETSVVHGAGKTTLKSLKTWAWNAPTTSLVFSANTVRRWL